MTNEHSPLLVQFFCLICAVAALSWAIMAKPIGIAPNASWRFSLANVCLGTGLALYTYRTDFPSFSAWIISDIILLSGFSFLRQGTQSLFKVVSSLPVDLGIIALTSLSLYSVQFQDKPIAKMVIIMSMATFMMFSLLALDNYRSQKDNLSRAVVIIIITPLAAVALLFLGRAIIVGLDPSQIKNIAAINSTEAEPVLWSYVALILLINIILISNTISHLVQKIRHIATRDQLTRLWNRHALAIHLTQVHTHWQRDKQTYSLLLLDIGQFKAINDTYGHQAGDGALRHVAKVLNNSLRKVDFVCRYSGKEFLVVLPNIPREQAVLIAEKLNSTLARAVFQWQKTVIAIQVSIGFATIEPDMTLEQLLKIADRALYQAKLQGPNTVFQGQCTTPNHAQRAMATHGVAATPD